MVAGSPYGELQDHTGDSQNSFLYTGEQYDQETQNYYLRARYYDPSNTRFLTRDTYDGTIAEPITQNHYAYANSNPTKYIDPSGNMSMMEITYSMGIGVAINTGLGFATNNIHSTEDLVMHIIVGALSGGVVVGTQKSIISLFSRFKNIQRSGLSRSQATRIDNLNEKLHNLYVRSIMA